MVHVVPLTCTQWYAHAPKHKRYYTAKRVGQGRWKEEKINKNGRPLSLRNASDINGPPRVTDGVTGVHPESLLFGHWATVALHSSLPWMSPLGELGRGGPGQKIFEM
ncbi:hypothetical protein CEXT_33371 [Caerostris extrusa]|uniref:Uncharacterized protein n=1 Tax=Caerostris extrusa TaxID=172846 RepID=A0AAV4T5L1_CAEEX|nr:hypothetical protein CEXT_33371 [Caerostris extrusa]